MRLRTVLALASAAALPAFAFAAPASAAVSTPAHPAVSANYPDGNSQYAESEVTGNPYTWTSYGTLYFRTSGTPSDYYTVHFTNGNELKRSYGDQCLYQNGVGINEGTCPANPGATSPYLWAFAGGTWSHWFNVKSGNCVTPNGSGPAEVDACGHGNSQNMQWFDAG